MAGTEGRIAIRLSPMRAKLLAQNIDGWLDAGACEGGLNPDEREALHSAFDQIMRGFKRLNVKYVDVR